MARYKVIEVKDNMLSSGYKVGEIKTKEELIDRFYLTLISWEGSVEELNKLLSVRELVFDCTE